MLYTVYHTVFLYGNRISQQRPFPAEVRTFTISNPFPFSFGFSTFQQESHQPIQTLQKSSKGESAALSTGGTAAQCSKMSRLESEEKGSTCGRIPLNSCVGNDLLFAGVFPAFSSRFPLFPAAVAPAPGYPAHIPLCELFRKAGISPPAGCASSANSFSLCSIRAGREISPF